MKIKSDDREIGQILKASYYEIPRFQRPYSWEPENVQQFWEDVIQTEDPDYFIGSMVVYPTNQDNKDTYAVVDGQQRLTTITMVLCAVRDALTQEGFSERAKGLNNFIERSDLENQVHPVLYSQTSYPYFQNAIQSMAKVQMIADVQVEELALKAAFELIKDLVKQAIEPIKADSTLSDEKKLERIGTKLSDIRDRLLSLSLIFVELDNEDDAYLIFETLNTRGKDLNVGDLVKNHLTRLLRKRSDKIDMSKTQWNRVRNTIHGSDADIKLDTFLLHQWLSSRDYLPANKLFKQFKKEIKTQADAQAMLTTLELDAQTYRDIHEPDSVKWHQHERDIRNSLDALLLFKVRQPTPMVLSVMRNYRNRRFRHKQIRMILGAIERFHFVFTAITSQRSSGGIAQMYAKAARQLEAAETLELRIEQLTTLREKLKQKRPSQDEFHVNFKELYFSNTNRKPGPLVRYILAGIHNHLNAAAPIDYRDHSIEHLLPQSAVETDIEGDLTEQFIGQLGNLILIPTKLNSELGSKPFNLKKMRLAEAGFVFDKVLAGADDWDVGLIKRRTEYLSDLAYNTVWSM